MYATETAPGRGSCAAPACGCGQDLDSCERDHCPRCGCEIRRIA